jgi:hypothetical protein
MALINIEEVDCSSCSIPGTSFVSGFYKCGDEVIVRYSAEDDQISYLDQEGINIIESLHIEAIKKQAMVLSEKIAVAEQRYDNANAINLDLEQHIAKMGRENASLNDIIEQMEAIADAAPKAKPLSATEAIILKEAGFSFENIMELSARGVVSGEGE